MAAAASFLNPLLALLSLLLICLSPSTLASTSCNGPCNNNDDCEGQLICTSGRCTDDPDVGTHICSTSSPAGSCGPSDMLQCKSGSYPTYTCSPPVSSSTDAMLTLNDFREGGDGGGWEKSHSGPSECDNSYHENTELVVALSTCWYDGGSRCGKMIRITSTSNGRSTTAKVVDECDSTKGCDKEHGWQKPCDNNIVDGSQAVWDALGLDTAPGRIPLICTNGRCTDDPEVGTHICRASSPAGSCRPSDMLQCKSGSFPTYTCSPPVSSSTDAMLTLNNFMEGGDGGAPSECDNSYHDNAELVVALSTGWYDGGSRCGKMIRITSTSNGRSTTAKVVDECDSTKGCDEEHAGQEPCHNNILDGSQAVWDALGLDTKPGNSATILLTNVPLLCSPAKSTTSSSSFLDEIN
ncbi:Kiwellin [Nymphaea thermarum]|nr:Kiwellin [Nymphaea thermarum]